jgi:hypothetical protein
MTQEEFDTTKFRKGMRAEYAGSTYIIWSIDFGEATFEIRKQGISQWVGFEKVTLIDKP